MPHLRRSSAGRGDSRGRGGLRARGSEGKKGKAVSERHSIASVTILRRLSPSLWLWRPGRSEDNLESCADVPRGRLPLRPRIGRTNPPWGLPLVAGSVSCPKLRPGLVLSWRGRCFLGFRVLGSAEWRVILGCTVNLRVPLWASQLIFIQASLRPCVRVTRACGSRSLDPGLFRAGLVPGTRQGDRRTRV